MMMMMVMTLDLNYHLRKICFASIGKTISIHYLSCQTAKKNKIIFLSVTNWKYVPTFCASTGNFVHRLTETSDHTGASTWNSLCFGFFAMLQGVCSKQTDKFRSESGGWKLGNLSLEQNFFIFLIDFLNLAKQKEEMKVLCSTENMNICNTFCFYLCKSVFV